MQQHRLGRDEWWASVKQALDDLDAEQAAAYQAESRRLGTASADGLDRGANDETLRSTLDL